MIYKKAANFPHPVLSNDSNSYVAPEFIFEVTFNETNDNYVFGIEIASLPTFLQTLLNAEQARLVFIIQSKDNLFIKLAAYERQITIDKNRVSFNYRTSVQLHVQLLEDITFTANNDLKPFYDQVKSDIFVTKNAILAYSNIVVFESFKKPFELFERKHVPNLKSDIAIELGTETIIINYKQKEFLFHSMTASSQLVNGYIYTGLHVALLNFVHNYGGDEEFVDIAEIDEPATGLDSKLLTLLKSKMIAEINKDNIDEVIYQVTDRIIEKYVDAVGRLNAHED